MVTGLGYFEAAKHVFVTGHPEESIDLFSKAYSEGYDEVQVLLGRGAAYLNTNQVDEAIRDFTGVLVKDFGNERGFYYRGLACLKNGHYKEAVEDLTQSVRMNSERGSAFFARGIAFAELGRHDEATLDFKTAAALSAREVEEFMHGFGSYRTIFERSVALMEGDRGPHAIVLTTDEVAKLQKWLQ